MPGIFGDTTSMDEALKRDGGQRRQEEKGGVGEEEEGGPGGKARVGG